jgi:[acyl-carrier-protein] S-malonyltransferase
VTYALLFPGQASQQVGMGLDLKALSAAAAEVYATADRVCALPVSNVIATGPLETLTTTIYAQPAVVATSLAALAVLRERLAGTALRPPAFCAGHSVGELAAYAAAGACSVETALALVARRSRLMAAACDQVDGTMAAVLGSEAEALRELCRQASSATGSTVVLANLNAPDQLVVSGHRAAILWLQEQHGARRVRLLNVGGPFHSPYMAPAAAEFARAVASAELTAPTIPVVLNQSASPSRDPAELRQELATQVSGPVRWGESLASMAAAGCDLFVEVGPGSVLSGLVRRTLPEARAIQVNDTNGLEQAVGLLLEQEAA